MLGQSQACLWLRIGLGEIKTVQDILCCRAGRKLSRKALGAWKRTGWSKVPPPAAEGRAGGVALASAYRPCVAPSSLGSLAEGARQTRLLEAPVTQEANLTSCSQTGPVH